jgi:hypothetical protein
MSDDEQYKQTLLRLTRLKERFELELETQGELCQAFTSWIENGKTLYAQLERHGKQLEASCETWTNIVLPLLREREDRDGADWWKGNE